MAYEAFITKIFQGKSRDMISTANEILAEYEADGYTLTLRQLYYQFVARGIIENSERSYKNLGSLVTDARMAGEMDWDSIEDRGRSQRGWLIEEDIDNLLRDLPRKFALDMWANQPNYVEVWIEKDALSNVVERACRKRRVPFLACKGYLSASEAYRAAKRFEAAAGDGKDCHVIHLGDHDPSGLDMTRDNQDRLSLMSSFGIEVNRIALNRDQIDHFNPPPNPAKITDSRAAEYIARHGRTSWELDALEPGVLVTLIQNEIELLVDDSIWTEDIDHERDSKYLLNGVSENWPEIVDLIRSNRGEDINEDFDEEGDSE